MSQESQRKPRYLAIDGGGTKTAFLLTDENGHEVKSITLGATNPNDIGMEKSKEILRQGIQLLCGDTCENIILYAGIAGARTGRNKEYLHQFLSKFGFERYGCGSDIDNLLALGDHAQQIFMILGTGIIAFAKRGDALFRIAGWGQLFDGAGSGYDLGRDAICAALYASDGTGPKTMLSELLRCELGENPADHLAAFYAGGKRYIASFARLIFEASAYGDEVAERILQRNVEHIVEILRAGAAKLDVSPVEVLMTGGLIDVQHEKILPLLVRKLGTGFCLKHSKLPPIYGALRLAQKEKKEC